MFYPLIVLSFCVCTTFCQNSLKTIENHRQVYTDTSNSSYLYFMSKMFDYMETKDATFKDHRADFKAEIATFESESDDMTNDFVSIRNKSVISTIPSLKITNLKNGNRKKKRGKKHRRNKKKSKLNNKSICVDKNNVTMHQHMNNTC